MLRRILAFATKIVLFSLILLVAGVAANLAFRWITRPPPDSAQGLINRADDLAWHNNWVPAAVLYARAERLFNQQGNKPGALYAKVSQVPVRMESASLPDLIAELNHDLQLPAAKPQEVRLRVLEMKAKCEEEYDASLSLETFAAVEGLALNQHRYYLASRASGEMGILAFTLGKFDDAAKRVKQAYAVAKYLGDATAHVRFASMIGAGLTQMGKARQALVFLDEAIETQRKHPEVARPFVALNAKIDSLSALGRFPEAIALADRELSNLQRLGYDGQLQSLLTSRAQAVYRSGNVGGAIADYRQALGHAKRLSSWRAINAIDGSLAAAYERSNDLAAALATVNDAIHANGQAPQEVFLVPGNLALKARILAEMGRRADAERIYEKGAKLIQALLSSVPTPEVEHSLLAQMGEFYSGYFRLVSDQGRLAEAFSIVEQARGQVASQQLNFDRPPAPQVEEPSKSNLQKIALRLVADADNSSPRQTTDSSFLAAELSKATKLRLRVPLAGVQEQLHEDELLIEYVLASSSSYALVVSRSEVKRYLLPPREEIENDASHYRQVLQKHTSDSALAGKLGAELLPFVGEYPGADSLSIVADGDLHLLPFGALADEHGKYLIETKTISVVPNGSVLYQLRTRPDQDVQHRSYLGVAPWAIAENTKSWVLARRSSGSQGSSDLVSLPESKDEVESIAAMMPESSTVLIGKQATRQKFESLPLREYRILHLALHGVIDPVFPDRSSLMFAPSKDSDGRLEARDIRHLKLQADLVTLSACNTAVGPVSSAGVESLDVAFIEAGADAVVSTLWELDDASTDAFMKDFYRELTHKSKSAALRNAQLKLLRQGMAPYYWATYELLGNSTGSPFTPALKVASR